MIHFEHLAYFAGIASIALAIFVFSREPKSVVRTSLLLCLGLFALEGVLGGMTVSASRPEDALFWYRLRLVAMALTPGCLLVFSQSYGRGNYNEYVQRWKNTVRAMYILTGVGLLLFWPGLAFLTPPGTIFPNVRLGRPGAVVQIVYILCSVLALTNLEYTLRESIGTMRWRVKYIALGFAVLLLMRMYTSSRELIFAELTDTLVTMNACALMVGAVLILLASLRGKLLSVDVYLSHQFLYGSVTLFIVGIYLIVVGLLAMLAGELGGIVYSNLRTFLILISLLGLAVLLLSDRVRQGTKRFVSSHFHRSEHDYRKVWKLFTERTASLMDIPSICRVVTTFVSETFDVLSATIWVLNPTRQRFEFGGSTSLSEAQAKELIKQITKDQGILAGLRKQKDPLELELAKNTWIRSLRNSSPGFFQTKHPAWVALKSHGQLLGVMMVGDRINDLAYSAEDLQLLQTIGDQVAAKLLTTHLAGELLQAKELEAFQTMSAFFVHDLKNTSSTLALMLRNLPRHFEDPEFRADALIAIRKSVEKINDLIRRLSLLRKGLSLHSQRKNLNHIIQTTLKSLDGSFPREPHLNLNNLPDILCDPDQIQTVITNLLLNARDATAKHGTIEIETNTNDHHVHLSVRDTGCGMTQEYQDSELFKPFRSSKKEGMGIGLFHSRMIVEAHGGSLEVESKIDHGSCFRLILPINGEKHETISPHRR